MEIVIRIIFGLLILGINYLIIEIFPNALFFSNYETDLKILIPFLSLLFLQPFVELFNPYRCVFSGLKKEINDDETFNFEQEVNYKGKDLVKLKIISVSSKNYHVSCKLLAIDDEFDTPEQLVAYLSKEKPTMKILFHLVPKNDTTDEEILVKYKINNRTKKTKLK